MTQNQLNQRLQFGQSQKDIPEVLNLPLFELKQFVMLSRGRKSHFGRRLCRTYIYCLRGFKDGGFGLQSEKNERGQSCISPYVTTAIYLGIAAYGRSVRAEAKSSTPTRIKICARGQHFLCAAQTSLMSMVDSTE